MRLPTQANAGVDLRRVDRLSVGLRRQSPGMCARSPRCRAGRSPTSGIERSPERPSPASTFRSGSGSTEIDLANLPPDLGEPRPGFVFLPMGKSERSFQAVRSFCLHALVRPKSARQHHTCTVPSRPLHPDNPPAPSARGTRADTLRCAPSSFGPKPVADRRPASHPTFPDERGGCDHEPANTPLSPPGSHARAKTRGAFTEPGAELPRSQASSA